MKTGNKRTICFFFNVHQPFRLKTYRFFNIGCDQTKRKQKYQEIFMMTL